MTDLATVLALAMDEAFPDDWYGHMVELLETRRGHALAALVEAAEEYHDAYAERWDKTMQSLRELPDEYRREADASLGMVRAVDAYREATR